MLPITHRTIVILLLVAAAVLRIIAALYLPPEMTWPDGQRYDEIARRLSTTGQYGIAFDPPGHPSLLAVSYFLFGPSVHAARLLWALLGTVTCYVVYRIARELLPPHVAACTLGLMSCYPLTSYLSVLPEYPQGLFTFVFSVAVLLLLQQTHSRSLARAVWLGLVSGVAVLTIPSALLFVGMALVWLFFIDPHAWAGRCLNVLLTVSVFVVAVLCWTIWHWSTTGQFFLISANGGINFYKGNCELMARYGDPDADDVLAAQGVPPGVDAAYDQHVATLAEARRLPDLRAKERFFYGQGWECIRAEPWRAVRLFTWKFLQYWRPVQPLVSDQIEKPRGVSLRNLVLAGTYLPLLVLSVGSLVVLRNRWRELMPLYLAIASQCLAYVLLHPSMRYRSVIDPLLIVLAVGVVWRCLFMRSWIARESSEEIAFAGITEK